MKAPILYRVFLPPSHWMARLSVQEFENLWGPHVELVILRPIPA